MKGFIKTALVIAIIACLVVYGKKYIDKNAVNTEDTVIASLREYYVSEDVKKLQPIIKLLENNANKPENISKINQVAYVEIGKWHNYEIAKFKCDLSNKMACNKSLEGLNKLYAKLNQIYTLKSSGEDHILSAANYKQLNDSLEGYIAQRKQVVMNSAAVNPRTNREDVINKCSYARNCTDCNGSNAKFCTCELDNNKISCPKNLVLGKIIDQR